MEDKKLAKVGVGHTPPHTVSSWLLQDNYYYTTILLKVTITHIDVVCLKQINEGMSSNICFPCRFDHSSGGDMLYSFGVMCHVA